MRRSFLPICLVATLAVCAWPSPAFAGPLGLYSAGNALVTGNLTVQGNFSSANNKVSSLPISSESSREIHPWGL